MSSPKQLAHLRAGAASGSSVTACPSRTGRSQCTGIKRTHAGQGDGCVGQCVLAPAHTGLSRSGSSNCSIDATGTVVRTVVSTVLGALAGAVKTNADAVSIISAKEISPKRRMGFGELRRDHRDDADVMKYCYLSSVHLYTPINRFTKPITARVCSSTAS